jgi:hypothetical protein
VFVAAAAGNDGPANQVNHIGPWLTTVGASTHDRFPRPTSAWATAELQRRLAEHHRAAGHHHPLGGRGVAGADATLAKLCCSIGSNGGKPVLDPAKVSGKIVTCVRGTMRASTEPGRAGSRRRRHGHGRQ